jgi:hypothetical protein
MVEYSSTGSDVETEEVFDGLYVRSRRSFPRQFSLKVSIKATSLGIGVPFLGQSSFACRDMNLLE